MSMPLPEYVPSPIREVILTEHGSLLAFSQNIDMPYTSLVNIFTRNDNRALTKFIELADRLGISNADELLEIFDVEPVERKKWLGEKLGKPNSAIQDFSPIGRSDRYLYSVISGQSAKQVRSMYHRLAKSLRMPLRELKNVLDSKTES